MLPTPASTVWSSTNALSVVFLPRERGRAARHRCRARADRARAGERRMLRLASRANTSIWPNRRASAKRSSRPTSSHNTTCVWFGRGVASPRISTGPGHAEVDEQRLGRVGIEQQVLAVTAIAVMLAPTSRAASRAAACAACAGPCRCPTRGIFAPTAGSSVRRTVSTSGSSGIGTPARPRAQRTRRCRASRRDGRRRSPVVASAASTARRRLTARSALRSVLRRWPNAAWTTFE